MQFVPFFDKDKLSFRIKRGERGINMRILLGLSGGVDSTYAALALKEAGHEVEAAVLLMHEYTSIDEARESADSLGIPLHVIDVREKFGKVVKANLVSEYTNARTPNPCVVCNSEIKFKYLLEYAEKNGFDKIATGHYSSISRLSDENGEYFGVCRGSDAKKDQTYMLWRLNQKILSKLVLPLEKLSKAEIREKTREKKLFAADRKDSQEICFLPDGNYAEYIESVKGKSEKGNFVDENGEILGEHKGIIHYTIGQRRGLGISSSSRIFVTDIDPKTNTVTLSKNDSYATRVKISGVVYSGMREPCGVCERTLSVKLRYAAPPVSARVVFSGNEAEIFLDAPVRAVTPGQSAVMYDGDLLVAGGFINEAH